MCVYRYTLCGLPQRPAPGRGADLAGMMVIIRGTESTVLTSDTGSRISPEPRAASKAWPGYTFISLALLSLNVIVL